MVALLKPAAVAQNPVALSGQVSSPEESRMEGVLVTAKKSGSTMSITVVSDEQGRYRFPSSKLDPGHYTLKIRAGGYDLAGPAEVDIPASGATANLTLKKAANLSAQLTNAEWLESMTGTAEQKTALQFCTTCHTLQRPLESSHDADEFVEIHKRMDSYVNQSSPLMPQLRLAPRLANQIEASAPGAQEKREQSLRRTAEYLAANNLSKGPEWPYPLKTFPRPKGRATRVIITEYDLPKLTRQPHDVILTSDGMAWYISFGEQVLGRLDPKTGKTTEYEIPILKPGSPRGELGLRPDEDGNLWIGMMYQGAVAKFDRKTEKFQTWNLPAQWNKDYSQVNEVNPIHSKVDGKVWTQDSGDYAIYRLDPVTGKFERFKPFPDPSPNIYDLAADPQNNVYFTVFGADQIGKIDGKNGKITLWTTPTKNSNPRRGSLDSQGRFWFGEWRGNRFGMFDTKAQTFKEWTPPTPWFFPYDVIGDKNGEAWGGSPMTDRVARLNSKTGEFTEYLMPRTTNIRRVFVDETTTPVTFWVGNNINASVIKLEPMD